jgi:hypothetical protein
MSCVKYDQETKISAVTKAETIVLQKQADQEYIVSLHLRVHGNLDGQARLSLMLQGKNYKSEHVSGNINFTYDGDWYSNSAEIRYEPINVAAGTLLIDYSFSTIND